MAAPAHAQPEFADGEVRSVDKANAEVIVKAGEIKSIDMPPMTMPSQVRDSRWLDKLQPGDKIQFRASNEAGKFTITELEPAK